MVMYESAWAAITKHQRLGGLKNRNLFLTVLEAGKSKIKVSIQFSGRGSLPGLQASSLHPHVGEREKKQGLWCLLLQGH